MAKERIFTKEKGVQEKSVLNSSFRLLLVSAAIVSLVFGMQGGALPLYLLKLGGTPTDIGMLSGISSIVAMFFRIPMGRILDRRGRQLVYLLGSVLYLVATAGYLMFPGIVPILVSRAVSGLGMCGTGLAIGALVADLCPDDVTNGMYSILLVQNLGTLFATTLGISMAEKWGYPVMLLATGIGFAISLVIACGMRYEKYLPQRAIPEKKSGGGIKDMIEPTALAPAICMMFHGIAHCGITGFVAAYGKTLGIDNIGYFFVIYGLAVFVVRPILGQFSARRYRNAVFHTGCAFFIMTLLLLLMSKGSVLIGVAGVTLAVAYSATQPSLNVLSMDRAPADRIGAANATYFVLWDFGFGVGSIVLGVIAAQTSYAAIFLIGLVSVAIMWAVYQIFLAKLATAS